MSNAQYVLRVHYVGRAPEMRRFVQPRIKIGRDAGDIVLGDPQASAVHAEIEFANGLLTVRDLGSSNGTFLGDRRLQNFNIAAGQSFRCGNTQIDVVQVIGAQAVTAGRTVMSEGDDAASRLAAAGVDPNAPATAAAAAAASEKGGRTALVLGLVGVLVLAAGGTAAFLLMPRGSSEELAHNDEGTDGGGADSGAVTSGGVDPESAAETGGAELVDAGEPEDKDMGQIYKDVGAATVVVRVPGSVGSGAIIDPSGVVLTNHHVIDTGTREGLKIKAKVVLGTYNDELKAFEPEQDQRSAHVLKIDEDHDLALIKIDDPPADLPHVELSDETPFPGMKVAAIGHAGVGMLWAIKGGEISATGSLSGHTDLLIQSGERYDDEALDRMKSVWERKGRTIQSTAKILPGDSGGPLVDMKGRIVGVNAFGRIDQSTQQWLSFHIHLAEVQAFTSEIPDRPLDVMPNPYKFHGKDSSLDDADLDGKPDALVLGGAEGMTGTAIMLDLDQDSGLSGKKAELDALTEKETYDAEFEVVMEFSGARHYWYDRDADGKRDLYVVDESGRGWDLAVYDLTERGAEKNTDLTIKTGFDPKIFTDPGLQDRFKTIGPVIFDEMEGSGSTGLPKPFAPSEKGLDLKDYDGDGKRDSAVQRTAFHERVFFDLDQNTIAVGTADQLRIAIADNAIEAEAVLISRGNQAWMYYDTNDDKVMDLVLATANRLSGVATEAFTLAADGTSTPAPEHVGRRLVRPGLLKTDARRLELAGAQRLGGMAVARGEGPLVSLPGLTPSESASVQMLPLGEEQHRVAEVNEAGYQTLWFDLDGDAFKKKADVAQAAVAVSNGDFDAELVVVKYGQLQWAYYDTNGDGTLDRVRFTSRGQGTSAESGFTVSGSALSYDAGSKGKSLLAGDVYADEKLVAAMEDALAVVKSRL